MKQLHKITIPAILLLLLAPFLTGPAARAGQAYDLSLMKSPAWVIQQLNTGNRLFLVDVRHKNQFALFKIPGSLNLPLGRVKTKQFLKTRPLILLNQGFVHSQLIQEAKTLNSRGYTVHVLQGGLLAWKHKGGKLVGNPFVQKDLNRISTRDLVLEQAHDNWIIVNAAGTQPKSVKKQLPKIIHPNGLKPKPIAPMDLVNTILAQPARLDKGLNIPARNPMLGVVLLTETGQGYDELEKKVRKSGRHRVFFLEDGLKGLETYLAHHHLSTAPKSGRTRSTGQCDPCKDKTDQ